MRHCRSKAGIVLMLCTTAVALTGCFDIMGDTVEDPIAGAIDPGPGTSNNPPTISGNPAPAIKIGKPYSFTPISSDPDGDALTFSIQNTPRWAQFDSSTGTLSGVPNLGDEGSYANIAIAVTDGSATTSLPSFAIDVTLIALGSVTLSWTPPIANSDGSTLTDLAAYKIYYGPSQGVYPNEIRIDNPSISIYVVDNLSPNTYFFVATAVNSYGFESDFSNVAIKTVTVN